MGNQCEKCKQMLNSEAEVQLDLTPKQVKHYDVQKNKQASNNFLSKKQIQDLQKPLLKTAFNTNFDTKYKNTKEQSGKQQTNNAHLQNFGNTHMSKQGEKDKNKNVKTQKSDKIQQGENDQLMAQKSQQQSKIQQQKSSNLQNNEDNDNEECFYQIRGSIFQSKHPCLQNSKQKQENKNSVIADKKEKIKQSPPFQSVNISKAIRNTRNNPQAQNEEELNKKLIRTNREIKNNFQ